MASDYPMAFGRKHGPPLLYLPGLDGTGRLLYRHEALGETYRVLCQSYPQDRKTTYEELAQEAALRLAEDGGGRPAVVVAESFGGGVALTLALSRPDTVERLVLVNTFARYPRRLLIRAGAILGSVCPSKRGPACVHALCSRYLFSPDTPPAARAELRQRTADVPLRALWRRCCMIAGLDLRARLAEMESPTLVLTSLNDRVVPPRAGRELAERLPRARLIELHAGHVALLHPSVDLAAILRHARDRDP